MNSEKIHWNENLVIFMKFSSLAALKVVILTTLNASSDQNFVKMTTFMFQCTSPCQVSYGAFFPSSLKKRYNKISRVHCTVYLSGCTPALPNDSLEPFLCHTKDVRAIITLIIWPKKNGACLKVAGLNVASGKRMFLTYGHHILISWDSS